MKMKGSGTAMDSSARALNAQKLISRQDRKFPPQQMPAGRKILLRLHQVFCARRVWREQDERVRVEQSLCYAMLCLTGTQPSCHSRASPREPLWCCLACRTSSTPPPGPAGRSERSLGHRQETLKVRVITDRIHAQTTKDMKYITVGMIYNFDPGAADLWGNCHSKRI